MKRVPNNTIGNCIKAAMRVKMPLLMLIKSPDNVVNKPAASRRTASVVVIKLAFLSFVIASIIETSINRLIPFQTRIALSRILIMVNEPDQRAIILLLPIVCDIKVFYEIII